jgi:hypothetical protein
MSNRLQIGVGLLAMAATVALIPASVDLIRESLEGRKAIAAARAPFKFAIRNTRILDATMYDTQQGASDESRRLLLVSVVASPGEAGAALRLWNSIKGDPLLGQTAMSLVVLGAGPTRTVATVPPDVVVRFPKNPEEFSTRTGIRVLPFSLIIANEDHVLVAGPGLPDEPFIRDAAERFVRDGASAETKFRRGTPEINAGLKDLDTLFQPSAAPR